MRDITILFSNDTYTVIRGLNYMYKQATSMVVIETEDTNVIIPRENVKLVGFSEDIDTTGFKALTYHY